MRNNEKHAGLDRKLCQWLYCEELYNSLFDPTKIHNKGFTFKRYASYLFNLECFVDELLMNDEIPFIISTDKFGTKEYNHSSLAKYFRLMPDFIDTVNLLSPNYYYNERIKVFISCFQSIKEEPSCYDRSKNKEKFNILVEKIRAEWKINNSQAKVNAKKKEVNHRYIEYCHYINSLFNKSDRLVVVRINLLYKKEYANSISVSEKINDLNRLFENKRCNSIFSLMSGYIAKLKYSINKETYWDVLFFFDDSEKNNYNHIHLAEGIGEYWTNSITKNQGDYWNINEKSNHYNKLGRHGILVVNSHEVNLITDLKFVVECFCKIDQFVRLKFDTKVRLLRRGNPPKKPVKKRGRPRKDMEDMT